MPSAADEFDSRKGQLTELVNDAETKLGQFKKDLDGATDLSDLQTLEYNPLLEAVQEIENAVDDMPEDVDVEEEE